jgi:molybdopterin converting factor small subunit
MMPRVKLKVNRWLSRDGEADSTNFEKILTSAWAGKSILGMVRRLAEENDSFRRAIFDGENQQIKPNIIVVLNGRIVNPYERLESTLKEGDELTFLPVQNGG